MTDLNPMSPPLWLRPESDKKLIDYPTTRNFSCKTCDVAWRDLGYTSKCWLCDTEIVIFNHKA